MLIDSNVIIYAAQPEHQAIRDLISEQSPAVSAVSYIEVLGYHRLTEEARHYFEDFFAAAQVLPITNEVVEQAMRLRQSRRMTLGDALIAGTALVNNLVLVTRNIEDFNWVEGLQLLNPFSSENRAD
jgi:predicted nucleic acid-binding protein